MLLLVERKLASYYDYGKPLTVQRHKGNHVLHDANSIAAK